MALPTLPNPHGSIDQHPWAGLEYDPQSSTAVNVVGIVPGGPADKAGLQVHDVLKEADGLQVNRGADSVIYLERYKSPGDTINLEISRNGSIVNKALSLEARKLMHPGP